MRGGGARLTIIFLGPKSADVDGVEVSKRLIGAGAGGSTAVLIEAVSSEIISKSSSKEYPSFFEGGSWTPQSTLRSSITPPRAARSKLISLASGFSLF